MKTKNSIISWSFFSLALAALVGLAGCKDDTTDPTPSNDPIASFQFSVDATNFLQVTFTNFSQNATSYAWDFGDGNTSTDESPVHTYAEDGTYTVKLTATGADGSAERSETVTVTDPDKQLTILAGTSSKTWYLQREDIALGIGPAIDDTQWWSFGGATPLGDRPCILDDEYTFHRDGTFEFNSNNTIFVDAAANGGWFETEGCRDETEAGTFDASLTGDGDVSAYGNGGSYTFDFSTANNTIVLNGSGAYIGLPTKRDADDQVAPVSVKTYTIFKLSEGDIADSLQIALVNPNGNHWNFYLVSYHNPADLPAIPGPETAADFNVATDGLTATFTNASKNATEYSWDFGDGSTPSTEANPVHTYASEGAYNVTLTATGNGQTASTTKEVVVSLAVFSADVLSNADGKVWKLAGAGSYKVGDAPNSGGWWAGPSAEEMAEGGARFCQADDEYIFMDGGTYKYDPMAQVFPDDYMGDVANAGCSDLSALTAPWDVYADAAVTSAYGFSVQEATGETPAMITVTGTGAFIGFSKPFNGGEYSAATTELATSVTYQVVDYQSSATKEILTVAVDFSAAQDGTAWWTMTVESIK